jgi:hypothetical protein
MSENITLRELLKGSGYTADVPDNVLDLPIVIPAGIEHKLTFANYSMTTHGNESEQHNNGSAYYAI